jgi:hypothetical protein
VLRFYAWLAATGAFLENHCSGFGTNSTPNHRWSWAAGHRGRANRPAAPRNRCGTCHRCPARARSQLDLEALCGHVGVPAEFFTQLHGSQNIMRSNQFAADAAAGALPALSMVWHDSPADEHPPADVTIGHDTIWQAVTAVVDAGLRDTTVFLLTWDGQLRGDSPKLI